jgi:hypothetical protein
MNEAKRNVAACAAWYREVEDMKLEEMLSPMAGTIRRSGGDD